MSAGIAEKDCGCKVFLQDGQVVHVNYCDRCWQEKVDAELEALFVGVDY